MNIQDENDLNKHFYLGCLHLFEAGKYFSNFDKEYANNIFKQAQMLLNEIKVKATKVSDEELDSILEKIMSFDLNDHEKLKDIETGLRVEMK